MYFAVDEMVAFMTTRLDEKETKFFPFNLGDEDGAGNPVVKGKAFYPLFMGRDSSERYASQNYKGIYVY